MLASNPPNRQELDGPRSVDHDSRERGHFEAQGWLKNLGLGRKRKARVAGFANQAV